jgi:hypothetical protein
MIGPAIVLWAHFVSHRTHWYATNRPHEIPGVVLSDPNRHGRNDCRIFRFHSDNTE